MNVIVQPGDGIELLLSGIKSAKKSIEIVIFRIDRRELEVALEEAVVRGVAVQALIAYTNREGEKRFRKLELRLLAAGVTVSRTADDLVHYHDKFMIIDPSTLYLSTEVLISSHHSAPDPSGRRAEVNGSLILNVAP